MSVNELVLITLIDEVLVLVIDIFEFGDSDVIVFVIDVFVFLDVRGVGKFVFFNGYKEEILNFDDDDVSVLVIDLLSLGNEKISVF